MAPVSINGSTGISGVDGSAGTPALQGSDSNTGIAFGSDVIIGSTGGTERFRCDSDGRMLVGTSTARSPLTHSSRLQVEGTDYSGSTVSIISDASDGSGPTLLLGKSRSGSLNGNTVVQDGDDLGQIYFLGADGSDLDSRAATIKAQVDGTPGNNDIPGRIVLSTTADGASSPTEAMRITQEQNIEIAKYATIATSSRLANARISISLTPGGFEVGTRTKPTSNSTYYPHVFESSSGSTLGSISVSTTATAYNTSSDYRLKENVAPVIDGITRLQQLKPSRFNFKVDPEKTVDGFLAHEVQSVVPEAITGEKDAVDKDGKPIYQGIDQSKLVPLLTAALQEAVAKIESLETRLAALEVTS